MKNKEQATNMTQVTKEDRKKRKKQTARKLCAPLLILHCTLFILSCARMGSPDGGWYDDTPPYVVSSIPADKGVGTTTKKVVINFNEFIKIDDPQNKVIISPPQIEQPEIKSAGKRILIELKDSLKDNTTYTIDFSDAISDNNEGNPMGNYTFSFSTGNRIDTLEVSGYVLNAEDLEPMKGVLVGLYSNHSDTIVRHEPMDRVSRTNGSGFFTIKGVAPGNYRIYALKDADGDFVFGQKSEMIAFTRDSISPTWKPDVRQDTIWADSLHIANIVQVPYTHFLPDDITLLCFQETQTDRYLLKTERSAPEKLDVYFSYGHDSLPAIRGLNFNADSAFVTEANEQRDSIMYWVRDTTLVNRDTLEVEMTFWKTDDSLGVLVQHTDTIAFLPKVPYAKRMKEKQKEIEKWEKEQEKKKKRAMPYDSVMPRKFLEPKLINGGNIAPDQNIYIETAEPLQKCDTAGIHLFVKVDSLWYHQPYTFETLTPRKAKLEVKWKMEAEYSLEIDSAAMVNIFGVENKPMKAGIKVKGLSEFSTLVVKVSGAPLQPSDSGTVIVQMLGSSGEIVKQVKVDKNGEAVFFYVNPSKYYLRAFCDMNGNGKWDTGLYDEGRQVEQVFYFPEEVECKEQWDVSRKWNLTSVPRYRQKPDKLIKQKPDQVRKLKNRNLDRAKQLGIKYVKKQGVNL